MRVTARLSYGLDALVDLAEANGPVEVAHSHAGDDSTVVNGPRPRPRHRPERVPLTG